MTRRLMCVFGVLIAATGCGSDSSSLPATPSGSVVSVAVNSSAPTMFLGGSETFIAVATYSGGESQTVTGGAWSTDTPSVAQVEVQSGRVVAVANGNATISVTYQGLHGSKQIRVLPNYGGNWLGNYFIASCTQTEQFADQNVCGSFNVSQAFQYTLQFTQAADVVSGLTTIGLLGSTSSSSQVGADGSLAFTTQIFVGTVSINLAWALTSTQANVINGSVTQTWTDSTTTGQMVIVGNLQPPAKQSPSLARTLKMGGPRRSLAEAVAAVRR